MEAKQIGTVEVTRLKVYPMNPYSDFVDVTVVVEPGTYELWRFDNTTFWMAEGLVNTRLLHLGDGMFVTGGEDVGLEGPLVRVPTRFMGKDEYATFLQGAPEWGLIVKEFDV